MTKTMITRPTAEAQAFVEAVEEDRAEHGPHSVPRPPKTTMPMTIERCIHRIRGQRIMLDADLAPFYGVSTRVLTQAVRRNRERFPGDFLFQLVADEVTILRSQTVISSLGHG